jgi:pyrroloquinoline-quinone synthase
MTTSDVTNQLELALDGRRLLTHPFYRRWEAGELDRNELARYAEQYVHIERCVPDVLGAAVDKMEPGAVRDRVAANLAEELGAPTSHLELFATFATAAGAGEVGPTPATQRLVQLCQDAAAAGPAEALAVLGAYEIQAAEIAESKADGLRRHYGFSSDDTVFWDVHASLEDDHAAGTIDALAMADPETVLSAARTAADLWWGFLDEREALAAVAS